MKHFVERSKYIANVRTKKLENLKKCLLSKQFIFKKIGHESEAVARASFRVAYLLAKKGKPFSDGDIFKKL